MKKPDGEALDNELAYLQQLFPSDPDETLIPDAVRMLASAGQFSEVAVCITQYVRAIAFLSSRRLEVEPLSSFPTERSLEDWQRRLNASKDDSVQHRIDVLFNRALTGFALTVKALIGFVNLPRDVRRAVRASRILWLSKDNADAILQINLAIDALHRWRPKWLKPTPYRFAILTNQPKSKHPKTLIEAILASSNRGTAYDLLMKSETSVALPSRHVEGASQTGAVNVTKDILAQNESTSEERGAQVVASRSKTSKSTLASPPKNAPSVVQDKPDGDDVERRYWWQLGMPQSFIRLAEHLEKQPGQRDTTDRINDALRQHPSRLLLNNKSNPESVAWWKKWVEKTRKFYRLRSRSEVKSSKTKRSRKARN